MTDNTQTFVALINENTGLREQIRQYRQGLAGIRLVLAQADTPKTRDAAADRALYLAEAYLAGVEAGA